VYRYAAGAGLGEFFDFEISADALMDEMMIHGWGCLYKLNPVDP
jgi:hypothetical protein